MQVMTWRSTLFSAMVALSILCSVVSTLPRRARARRSSFECRTLVACARIVGRILSFRCITPRGQTLCLPLILMYSPLVVPRYLTDNIGIYDRVVYSDAFALADNLELAVLRGEIEAVRNATVATVNNEATKQLMLMKQIEAMRNATSTAAG